MFHFRLQKVLELRELSEQESASRLAAARSDADAAHSAHAALEAAREGAAERGPAGPGRPATAGQLRNLSYLVEHLNRQIGEARSVAMAADENVRKLLAEFTTAFQERRVLDRLRDRQHDEWRQGEAQTDRRAMDAVALSRFIRGAQPGTAGGER